MLNGFVNKGTDNSLVNFLQPNHELEKSMDKSGLVQKQVTVNGKHGTHTRMQWVKANEEQAGGSSSPQPDSVDTGKKPKRKQRPATPHNLTENTKHLKPIEDFSEMPEHIKTLDKPIPPSWRNVMISGDPNADVYAIGKDDQDRPQYIYNPEVVKRNQAEKFKRVRALMDSKETLEKAIDSMEDRETADCLTLILHMGIRPGSTRDTKADKEALGATTLRGENVVVEGSQVFLRFTGKKGVYQDHVVPNSNLASMLVQRKKNVAGSEDLFATSDRKLRKALEPLGIHPKDLRTMLATSTAQEVLSSIEPTNDPKAVAKVRKQVAQEVCQLLGNQPTMALKAYIDPAVFEEWSPEGFSAWKQAEENKKSKKEAKENE